jgi:hypothetical protein
MVWKDVFSRGKGKARRSGGLGDGECRDPLFLTFLGLDIGRLEVGKSNGSILG